LSRTGLLLFLFFNDLFAPEIFIYLCAGGVVVILAIVLFSLEAASGILIITFQKLHTESFCSPETSSIVSVLFLYH